MSKVSQDTLMLLQAFLAMMQFINAGLSAIQHTNVYVVLIVGGICSGMTLYVQLLGNRSKPGETTEEGSAKNGDKG